ncbi:MAG: QueT transporter family protein [Candidatus Bathyarchaeia archaeon]
MKAKSRDLALIATVAALYTVLVWALAGISFQLVQVRVADALIPLSMVFGWPVILGVTMGCVVANVATPMPSGWADITLGSIANFVASLLALKIGNWKLTNDTISEFLGCITATAAVTFIVGTYLAIITEMELWVWWLGIGVGSIVSITVLGFALVKMIKKVLTKTKVT